MSKFMPLVLCLGFLSGCSSLGYQQGTEVSQAQMQQFKIGVTTRQQVLAALGAPAKQGSVGGGQYFQYESLKMYGGLFVNPADMTKSSVTVFVFDAKDVLKEIQTGAGNPTNPLLQAAGQR